MVTVDGKEQAAQKVEISGHLDTVIKKLEAQIVALKEKGDLKESTADQVKALKQALDTLKADANVSQKGDDGRPHGQADHGEARLCPRDAGR